MKTFSDHEFEPFRQARQAKLRLVVGKKLGTIKVYGLGKLPVNLYDWQLLKLLESGEEIRAFIENSKDNK